VVALDEAVALAEGKGHAVGAEQARALQASAAG
jgi:hypothetical protein